MPLRGIPVRHGAAVAWAKNVEEAARLMKPSHTVFLMSKKMEPLLDPNWVYVSSKSRELLASWHAEP